MNNRAVYARSTRQSRHRYGAKDGNEYQKDPYKGIIARKMVEKRFFLGF